MKKIFIFLAWLPFLAKSQTITTIAGTGIFGFDTNTVATTSKLAQPFGLATDVGGNVYIADEGVNRIRKVSSTGMISTVAGNGLAGYNGDGIAATNAKLAYACDVAIDAVGNLFLADWTNYRVRKVDTAGIIHTIAGTGIQGYSGEGGDATAAKLDAVSGVAIDISGSIFIAEYGGNRIRKINSAGTITTVAGNGVSGFSGDGGPATAATLNHPEGLSVDLIGNIFIADAGNSVIRKVDTSGIIHTIAGNFIFSYSGDGGPATGASLCYPTAVKVDGMGNVYISDWCNDRIRLVNTSGVISTIVGLGITGYGGDGGPATAALLDRPSSIAIGSGGNLYISDFNNECVRKVAGTTFVEQLQKSNVVSCFPNPVSNFLYLSANFIIERAEISNSIGQLVLSVNISKQKAEIDVSGLPRGLYFITLNGVETKKFVKQ